MESLKSLLTVPYQQDNFRKFSINFLKNMETVPIQENRNIPSSFRNTIESYIVFGKYKDEENNNVIVLSVKVKNNSSAQKAQRQFISHLLANEFIDFNAALVAYYDDVRKNWKLSFVTIEYSFNEKGVELKFKPAKRFSFLVGKDEPTKTYCQQLNPIYESNDRPTLKSLTDAFSVSRLSKDFYEDYKKKFFELYDYLISNSVFVSEAKRIGYRQESDVERFATTFCKKTLGQIMFLHFVQKKGWLGVTKEWGDGDKQYMIHSTANFQGSNYFNDFLEPLFYNALNVKRENDLYLGKKVPFLNGGLFQPIEQYDWENTNFGIPNNYWFNKNETGLLNVLSQYNFTVDEADPEEQEVAIDPEMLGKIFESLLDTKDRSSLGAFYTPREIVHFMCEEALAARISKVLDLDYESILNYVRYGDALKETEFIKTFAEDIDEYVCKLTIVDPAVGSGAFLVGMLNQIVKLRMNLLQFTDKCIDKYDIKMTAIQNSLYGVDLEYDAVEIAKLRLWLSLIVDQKTNGEAPNPLPNLNFHLRVGNSLVDSYESIKLWNVRWRGSKKVKEKVIIQPDLFNTETVDLILDRLKKAKVKYFSTSDEKEKRYLSSRIEQEQIELIRSELVAKGKFDVLYEIEEMLKKKTKPFFVWELEFEEVFENGGFDIVIANPPYVQLQKDNGKLANELKDQGYQTFTRMGDIYCIFYEKATYLLKNKGVMCFITSNKWMRAGYGEKLRGFLAKNTNPIKLIDLSGSKVFQSATVDVNIFIAIAEPNLGKTNAVNIGPDYLNNMSDYIKHKSIEIKFTENNSWVIYSKDNKNILDKISVGKPLSEWDVVINRGILTGFNEAFIIDTETRNLIVQKEPKSAEFIRPLLRGKDIFRYEYKKSNLWLIFIPWHFPLHKDQSIVGASAKAEEAFQNDYPVIYNHLLKYKDKLSKRNKAETGIRYEWYALQRWGAKYSDDFFKQKIIYPNMTKYMPFYLDDDQFFTNQKCFIITGSHLGYLTAFLNSKLFKFCYRDAFPELQGGTRELSKIFFEKIRIKDVSDDMNLIFDRLVKEIQLCKKEGLNTLDLEEKVENLLYDIYGLDEKEKDLVKTFSI